MARSTSPSPEALVLGLCVVALVAHQATHWTWTIEDAAICFAYARNLAEGLGAVPSPGGERVEAVSDPSWVALLAVFQALGLDGFQVAKPLAMAFGAGTAWLVWRTAGLALPDRRGADASIAPVALAANAQFAIWSASGLENGLFNFLLAGAIHRTALEVGTDRFPRASIWYLLLALTRPEGVVYAGLGFVALAGSVLVDRRAGAPRRLAPLGQWLAVLLVPLALTELARIWYFAWPLPNPFYAKVVSKGVAPLDWQSRGWLQLREWSARLWQGYWLPVYAFGLSGLTGGRARLVGAVLAALGASLLLPGPSALRSLPSWPELPEPEAWNVVRAGALLSAGALLPLVALGTPGGRVRALCGASVFTGLGFSVFADGDWMGGYRFMSLVAAPLSVLFAAGVSAAVDWVDAAWGSTRAPTWGPAGWIAASLCTASLIPPNFAQTQDHAQWNRDETPQMIKRRVDYLRGVSRLAFHDDPVSNLDIDQGAFLFWAPEFRQYDLGMLVEIPTARHWFQQRAFVEEYVFHETKPTFVNCGGWLVGLSGLRDYPQWKESYFETPGYTAPHGGRFGGVFARRDLFVRRGWERRPEARAVFDGSLALEGVEVPAPWTPGQPGFFAAPTSRGDARPTQVTPVAFLSRGREVVASWALRPGAGVFPMGSWRRDEVLLGRYSVAVPPTVAPGTYDLGFVLLGLDGAVVEVVEVGAAATSSAPVFAAGEVRYPGVVEVVDPVAFGLRTAAQQTAALTAAADGACAAAEDEWVRLKRHRPVDWAWHAELEPSVGRALADCWARAAAADPAPEQALARAHRWDFTSPELERVGGPVGERLLAEGAAAAARGDWEEAYDRYSALLRFQPWRSWARRWAEQARDHRLGLTDDVRVGDGSAAALRASGAGDVP